MSNSETDENWLNYVRRFGAMSAEEQQRAKESMSASQRYTLDRLLAGKLQPTMSRGGLIGALTTIKCNNCGAVGRPVWVQQGSEKKEWALAALWMPLLALLIAGLIGQWGGLAFWERFFVPSVVLLLLLAVPWGIYRFRRIFSTQPACAVCGSTYVAKISRI